MTCAVQSSPDGRFIGECVAARRVTMDGYITPSWHPTVRTHNMSPAFSRMQHEVSGPKHRAPSGQHVAVRLREEARHSPYSAACISAVARGA